MITSEFINKDRFAAFIGIEMIEVSEGKAKARLEITEQHLNAVDIAQGGAIFTLADLVLAAAANSYGKLAVSINASITYFKPAMKGMLYAEAFEISKTRKLATYKINVINEEGSLVATLVGTVYRKEEMI